MKKIILFILIFKISLLFSQVDTCHIDSNVRNLYYNDAIYLTYDLVQDTAYPYHDSIHLPQTQANKILKDMGMVYYLSGPERDTVISLYHIHYNHCPIYKRNEIIIMPDTNYLWVKQFIYDSIISGNLIFDSLIAGNDFKLGDYSQYYNYIDVYTDSTYNLTSIIEKLNTIPGVIYAMEGAPLAGDGDYIKYNSTSTYEELIYSHGWGDCPSGCTSRCFWVFHVFSDCSSSFIYRYGDNLLNTDIYYNKGKQEINIYPNPTNNNITLELLKQLQSKESTISIYNIQGQLLSRITTQQAITDINVSNLSKGVYFLKIEIANEVMFKKFAKE